MIDLTVLLRSFKLSDSKDSIPVNTTTEYPDLSRTRYVPYDGGQVRKDIRPNNALFWNSICFSLQQVLTNINNGYEVLDFNDDVSTH